MKTNRTKLLEKRHNRTHIVCEIRRIDINTYTLCKLFTMTGVKNELVTTDGETELMIKLARKVSEH